MKIGDAFEPGNRKTTMALIALVGSVLLEKYGGGISPDLKEMILAIFAIFTGGNVLSKGIQAAKEIKVQKQVVTDVVTDLVENAQEKQTEDDPRIQQIIDHVNKLDQAAGSEIKGLKESVEKVAASVDATSKSVQDVSDRLDVQVTNLSQVLKIINGMRSGTQPTA